MILGRYVHHLWVMWDQYPLFLILYWSSTGLPFFGRKTIYIATWHMISRWDLHTAGFAHTDRVRLIGSERSRSLRSEGSIGSAGSSKYLSVWEYNIYWEIFDTIGYTNHTRPENVTTLPLTQQSYNSRILQQAHRNQASLPHFQHTVHSTTAGRRQR